MRPHVSIIMPVYNTGHILRNTIDSILCQTYANFELLIIDDGSIDISKDICDEYALKDNRIKVFHKINGGICNSRNFGLINARGKYVTFCDHDDIYDPTLLDKALTAMIKYDADVVKFRFYSINMQKNSKWELPLWKGNNVIENIDSHLLKLDNLYYYDTIWTFMYILDVLKKNNIIFDEHFLHGGEDFDFNIRLLPYIKKMVIIPDILYIHYYRNELSTSAKLYPDILNNFIKQIYAFNSIILKLNINVNDYLLEYNISFSNRIRGYISYACKMHYNYTYIIKGLNQMHKDYLLSDYSLKMKNWLLLLPNIKDFICMYLFVKGKYRLLYRVIKFYCR